MPTSYILIDSSFWIDLVDPRNSINIDEIEATFELIREHFWLVPMPSLYETLRTRFIRNTDGMFRFQSIIRQPHTTIISDAHYRDDSLQEVIDRNNFLMRKFSLVDIVIRNILKDPNIRVDYLVTKNKKDFFDLCSIRGIDIL